MYNLLFLLFAFLILNVLIRKSLIIIGENQRMVCLRLGKLESIHGPGVHFIVPFVDIPVRVNLSNHLPEWQTMNTEEIDEKVKQMVMFDPDPKKYK